MLEIKRYIKKDELQKGMMVNLNYQRKDKEGRVEAIGHDWVVCRDKEGKIHLLMFPEVFEFIED